MFLLSSTEWLDAAYGFCVVCGLVAFLSVVFEMIGGNLWWVPFGLALTAFWAAMGWLCIHFS